MFVLMLKKFDYYCEKAKKSMVSFWFYGGKNRDANRRQRDGADRTGEEV